MDISIWGLPRDLNEWDITRFLAKSFFHNPRYNPVEDGERVTNFKVVLNASQNGGVGNDGTGILSVPTRKMAKDFRRCLKTMKDDGNPLKINGVPFNLGKETSSSRLLKELLGKTPYVDPNKEEEHEQIIRDLDFAFRIDEAQIGTYYRDQYPRNSKDTLVPRSFSIEWSQNYEKTSAAWLTFEYDHKLLRIELGDSTTEEVGHSVAISFSNIKKIGVGYDGKAYLCFDTETPCILERKNFHRTLYGSAADNEKYKERAAELDPAHANIKQYAHQLRVLLYPDAQFDDIIKEFVKRCKRAGLSQNQILLCGGNGIDASSQRFFNQKSLYKIEQRLVQEPWAVAFQIEALLRCGLFNTNDLEKINPLINTAKKIRGVEYCGATLAKYIQLLRGNNLKRNPVQIFTDLYTTFKNLELNTSRSQVPCYHITFTPSRKILEGPLPTQSNRILRQYYDYLDNFIRVDFRDEDRLQYRWDKSIDGASFVRERVGGILKHGFRLAGRNFEFLAYSSSALREHAVWFIHPFMDKNGNWINGESIREQIGNFEGSELLRQPSKYGARLAQAFTATDPGVLIKRHEWKIIDDLGVKPHWHSDGCGTISTTFGGLIWETLVKARPELANYHPPSVYQIRFLGFKGIVSIDPQLEETLPGIHMCLRPTMKKFDSRKEECEEDEIEIVKPFYSPNLPYLNRAFIMVLEDLGVTVRNFQKLQDRAIREIRTVDDSSRHFRQVLYNHKLGTKFRLARTIEKLESLGGDIHSSSGPNCYDNTFLKTVRNATKATVLRDIKHNARIPIASDTHPNFLLIGMVDEGPAYAKQGKDVYCLDSGKIFACVQMSKDEEPIWLKGRCTVSRSPIAHPGDVQMVYAIGKPPTDKLCLFADIRNAVVFSSLENERSLASKLSGGDVDGDMFCILLEPSLLPMMTEAPAEYPIGHPWTLDRTADVTDICDFVVEYINSDVLGLLSDRLLVIADQSKEGIKDRNCALLAELCSKAVDYPKNGVPVDLVQNPLPRTLIRCKPDWHAAEVVSPRKLDYYESSRALGILFRDRNLDFPEESVTSGLFDPVFPNPITELLREEVETHIIFLCPLTGIDAEFRTIFSKYTHELTYVCTVNTLTNAPGVSLLESEIVVGTILAKCSQRRLRSSRIEQMKLHIDMLVRSIQKEIQGFERVHEAEKNEILLGLQRAWEMWKFTTDRTNRFGGNSLGLLTLRIICDCLHQLEQLRY